MPTDNSNAFSPQDLTRTEDQNRAFPNARGQVVPAIESAPEEPQDWQTPMAEPEGGWQQEGTPLTIQARPKEVNKILNSKHVLSDVDTSDPSNARVFVANFLNSKYDEDKRGIYKDYEGKTKAYGLSGDPVADAKSILDGDTKTHESSQTRIAKDRKVIAEGLDKLGYEERQGFGANAKNTFDRGFLDLGVGTAAQGALKGIESMGDEMERIERGLFEDLGITYYDEELGGPVTSEDVQKWREDVRERNTVDPEFLNSYTGGVIQGYGQAAAIVPAFLLNPAVGTGMSVAQAYQYGEDGYRDFVKSEGITYEESEARKAGLWNMPSAAVDVIANRFAIGKILKPLKGAKITKGGALEFLKDTAESAAMGSGTEGVQTVWENLNAKYLSGYDRDKVLTDGVVDAMVIGAFVDSTITAGGQGVTKGVNKLLGKTMDPVEGMTAVDWALALNVVPEAEFAEHVEREYGDEVTEDGVPLAELAWAARGGDRKAAQTLVDTLTLEVSVRAKEAGLTPAEAEARGKEAAEVADPVEPLVETAIDKEISTKKEELAALEEAEGAGIEAAEAPSSPYAEGDVDENGVPLSDAYEWGRAAADRGNYRTPEKASEAARSNVGDKRADATEAGYRDQQKYNLDKRVQSKAGAKDMKSYEKLDKEIQALETKRDENQRPADVLSAQAREEAVAEEAGLLTRRAEDEIEIDKAEEVADAIDFFEQRSRGGVVKDYKPDTRKGGEALIKQMRRAGMSKKEIAAKSLQIMTEAGRPNDRLSDQVVRGEQTSNSKAGNDFRATVKLYKDADPMDVAEEYIHAETDREVNEGTVNYEDIAAYREQVESITSGEDTRGNTEGDHKEWIAEQVKARLLGNRHDTRLPESFARFIDRIISRLRNLFTRANELIELEAQGMLPDGFVELLDRLGSMDDDALMQSIQAEQAAETASDPKDELLEVMKRNKLSVPRPDSDPSHRGELETYFESIGKKWKYLKKGGSLDSLKEGLQAAGFNVDTPSDVLDLLDRSARGEAIYANTDSRSAAQQTADETFSLDPEVRLDRGAESSFSLEPEEYRGQHEAPNRTDEISASLDALGDVYPSDIYSSKALQYYGTGDDYMDRQSIDILQGLADDPDAKVTIHRAIPVDANEEINAGDWVTVNYGYAEMHGESALNGDYVIVSEEVPASDVFTNADSIHEQGYDPKAPSYSLAPDTPAFKSWFGDSKVVDENGEPMVVNHGTIAKDFKEFSVSRDLGYHFGDIGQAHVVGFREDMYVDEEYDDLGELSERAPRGRIIPVYLSIKNPLRMEDQGGWIGHDAVMAINEAAGTSINGSAGAASIKSALQDAGYDGIIYKNDFEGDGTQDAYIAFKPTQIKSAIGNRGTFDPNDPRINYSLEASIEPVVDEDGEVDYEADDALRKIAKDRDLGITSDREVHMVARDDDGKIIGGSFTSEEEGNYTFDIVVSEDAEGTGLGAKLLDDVIELPYDFLDVYPDGTMEVDVVSPKMKSMLERRGFQVKEETGKDRWLMEPIDINNVGKPTEPTFSLEPLFEQDADSIVTERTEEIQSRTPERQAFIDYQRELRRTQLDNTEEEKEKLQKLLQLATDADEIEALKQAGDEKIIRVVEQKVKQIRKQAAEREDVTESVKALERLINSPEVPMEVRARMRGYGRLAERKTPQGKARWVEHMANKLEAEIDRHYRTRNVRTLRSLLRPFATEYAPNRRKLRERVGEEARADLNFAQRLLNNSEATPPEGMTDERRDELIDIFGDVGNRQSNPTRVKAALEIAGSIAKGGRTARDDFKEDRRQRNEQVGDLVREEVLNGEEAMGKSQIAAREKQRNVFKKGYDYMRSRLIRGMEGFQQQLNKMDSVKGGILEDLFLPAVYQADQNEKALNREHVERVNEDFKTVLGTDNRQAASWYKNSHELHDTDIEWIEDRAIGMEKRTISKQQGVALFMQWLDPSLRSTFSNMGINEATIEQVKEFIGEIGVSEAYYFRERYAEMGIKLNAKHMEVEGIPLDMIDGYGGRARRINSVGSRQEDMQMFSTNSSGRPTVKSGSMKERTNSTDYLIFQDAAMDFSAHAKEVNHYISHAELAKNLSAAFLNNARARNAITQKHGSDFYDALKAQVEYIIEGNPIVTNKIHRDMDKLRSNVTKAQLMVKPAILVKQLTSAPAFVEEIGPVAYAKAAASLTRNARKFMPMIWGSEYVKNRMSNSQFVDIQQQLDQRDNTLKGLRWDDYAMMNIKWGDIGAVIAGGAPVYVHTYNEAKAAGMTNDQAQAKAEEVFGLASERAQQSSAGHAKGAFLREEGIARTWFMYLTSPLQYQRNVNTSIANLVANVFEKKAGRKSEVKKAANQALRAIVVYHVILPQIFQAVASGLVGFTDDEDYIKEQFWAKQRRALYMGNFNSFPVVGALISKAANLVAETGENFNSSGSPLLDLVQNTTADFHKALKNGDSLDAWLDLGENASLVLGIPAKTVKSYYEAFTDISEGNTENPLLRALGWSKWSLFED